MPRPQPGTGPRTAACDLESERVPHMSSTLLVDQIAPFVARREWEQVHDLLADAHVCDQLGGVMLETFAEALWWLGRVNDCIVARQQVMDGCERGGDRIGAARIALLLSEDHRRQGRGAIAESWRRRAANLLDGEPECSQHGYLRLYEGERARRTGQLDVAGERLKEAGGIAQRCGDADLAADVTQEAGRVLILRGAHVEGLAVMDEAMLAATDGRLSPYTTGKIYCCLMSACDELGDVERITEWERSSSAWSREAGMNVFPGMCRVHHADLLAHLGQWSQAEQEAERACDELREVGWVVAYAYETLGRIRRRRGDLAGSAAALMRADELGMSPDGEWSLLLLARGDVAGAMRRITRSLATSTSPPLRRSRLLPAAIEVAVVAGDQGAASTALTELEETAAAYGTLKLQATASLARSRVCLARGDWVAASASASVAVRQWLDLAAPYEVATARVLYARACRALDDHDAWTTSLELAAGVFRALGAAADLADLDRFPGRPATTSPSRSRAHTRGSLSARELEVLRLLATGATNKAIAAALVVSQKTIARHLSNIFAKLGVSTRAAATAYAYEHGIAHGAAGPHRHVGG